MSEELRQAYELKEAYCAWFKEAKERGPDGMVKESLLQYYKLVESVGVPEFCRAIQTFKNWQTEILNSFSFDTQVQRDWESCGLG